MPNNKPNFLFILADDIAVDALRIEMVGVPAHQRWGLFKRAVAETDRLVVSAEECE